MYCIGLTGTVASGKSTAIAYFKTLGIDTLSADEIARQLTTKDSPALAQMTHHFGKKILAPNGELDRAGLRQKIMRHPDDRLWLENLLHPMIRQQIEREIAACTSPYCVIEIPLLTSRESYSYLNRILLITSDNQQQIQRLMKRDHCSEADAIQLLDHQEKTNNRHEIADDIVFNEGSVSEFHQKLFQLHQIYTQHNILS